MKILKSNIDIIIILLIGFLLRFTISFTHSYSNDELSAINRLQFDDLGDLIEKGVKTGDMHPAGVQLFMKFWSNIGGVHELGMRFPFVIFGCVSIFLVFLIGNKWVNRETGLFASAMLAFLYFPVMNAEFARPYSPGLMFSLLTAWYGLKLLFEEDVNVKVALLLGLSAAGAMYTHYFAFLFVGWIAVTLLIFISKERLKLALIALATAVVLFLPHIGITTYQLSVGGLQWLGPPSVNWLFEFLFHGFNESWVVLTALIIAIGLSLAIQKKTVLLKKKSIYLFVLWFFGIYVIGHIYSLIGTPVLKFPVMLFAFPFLLLLIGNIYSRFRYTAPLFAILMIVISTSTIRERDLYGNMHYELFEEIAEDIVRWNDTYGEENIYTVYNINNPNYMNFYANQWGKEIAFDWDVIDYGDEAQIREDLLKRSENYCIVGYSARNTTLQVFETCHEVYPYVVEQYRYNNAAVSLLCRWPPNRVNIKREKIAVFNPVAENEDWFYPSENILSKTDDSFNTFLKALEVKPDNPYGPEYRLDVSHIQDRAEKFIYVEVFASGEAVELTASVSGIRDGSEVYFRGEPWWYGVDQDDMISTSNRGYLAFEIPDFMRETDQLKISFWNRNPKRSVFIGKVNIYVSENGWK